MEVRNSLQDGSGRLNFTDFSKWLGAEIHNLAGFFFRHDSKKNPVLDKFFQDEKYLKREKKKEEASVSLMNHGDVLQKLISKIRQQWKTVRKAFHDFNEDNDQYI